jgi:hypothetical protein
MATPTPGQLVRINQLALVPLSEDQAHVFEARIIGTKVIEKYKTRLSASLLQKFALQVKEGIALLVDHPWMKFGGLSFPYGRTFDSRIVQEGNELELFGDHYMLKGQEVNGISTDQLANGIDAGTIFDTSAGYVSTKEMCNICNGPYFGNDACNHFKGRVYEGIECITETVDGYIMENSIVFDGGYEGAGITKRNLSKSQTGDENDQIEYEPLLLDAKSLPGDGSIFYIFSNNKGANAFIPKQQINESANVLAEGDETMAMTEEEKQALQQAQNSLTLSNGLLTQIRTALGVTTDEGILSKITSVNSLAQVGEQYKTKITDAACGAGVRAMGDAFNVEAMKLSLANLPVAEIEKINASYEAQALIVLGGGGQHTQQADVTLPAGALSGTSPTNPNADGSAKTPEQLRATAKEEARASLARTGHGNLLKGDK